MSMGLRDRRTRRVPQRYSVDNEDYGLDRVERPAWVHQDPVFDAELSRHCAFPSLSLDFEGPTPSELFRAERERQRVQRELDLEVQQQLMEQEETEEGENEDEENEHQDEENEHGESGVVADQDRVVTLSEQDDDEEQHPAEQHDDWIARNWDELKDHVVPQATVDMTDEEREKAKQHAEEILPRWLSMPDEPEPQTVRQTRERRQKKVTFDLLEEIEEEEEIKEVYAEDKEDKTFFPRSGARKPGARRKKKAVQDALVEAQRARWREKKARTRNRQKTGNTPPAASRATPRAPHGATSVPGPSVRSALPTPSTVENPAAEQSSSPSHGLPLPSSPTSTPIAPTIITTPSPITALPSSSSPLIAAVADAQNTVNQPALAKTKIKITRKRTPLPTGRPSAPVAPVAEHPHL